jgi:virginiamycin B lyase
MRRLPFAIVAALAVFRASAEDVSYFPVPPGAGPHDVAPAPDGTVWYTAQRQGALGRLNPATGRVEQIPLGGGSAPHGVIVGPDGAAWVTDSGLNAIVRVDPTTRAVRTFPLPDARTSVNLNTATFDRRGRLWFTGQGGVYGRLDPRTDELQVWDAPRGPGPYGIATTPDGAVFYASLAGSHIARIDVATGQATVIDPPTRGQGARRVWSDSKGRVWVSEWNSGQVSVHDPSSGTWRTWKLPGEKPRAYSVYVDEKDHVWLTDFSANAIVRFDPVSERFASFPSDRPSANVRQLLGRKGEVWGAESGTDRLVRVRGSPGTPP